MTLEYAVHIERLAESDGGFYLATVPDLPGCMSDGETPEERAGGDRLVDRVGQGMEAGDPEAVAAFGAGGINGVDMREPAVAYLLEQAEKFRVLKALVDEGIEDVRAGRVSEWDFAAFLRERSEAE